MVMVIVTVAATVAMLAVVVVVVMMVMMLFIMVMIMTSTSAMLIVIMVIMVTVVVMIVIMVMLFIVVVAVTTASTMLTVIVVIVVIVIMMLMIVMLMMVMMLVLFLECLYCILKSVLMLHCRKDLLTVKTIPRGCDKNCVLVMLTKKLYAFGGLLLACRLGMRKHDCRRISDLVVIELAKVLHIHLALLNVGNGCKAIKHCTVLLCSLCCANNVRKLTNTRGLDNNSVGLEFVKHLYKCLRKIAYK